ALADRPGAQDHRPARPATAAGHRPTPRRGRETGCQGEVMPTVRIPTPLRKITNGLEEVSASGKTVAEIIADLEKRYPGMKDRICDDKGQLRRFVNIFANDEDIRFLSNLDTPVKEADEISIVPAIAGGHAG